MDFVLLSFLAVGLIVLVLVLLARAYPGSGADLVDWKPTRSPEVEAELEERDLREMLDAQNIYRRRRGAPDLTEEDAHRMAAENEAWRRKHQGAYDRLVGQSDDEPAE